MKIFIGIQKLSLKVLRSCLQIGTATFLLNESEMYYLTVQDLPV